MKRFAAAIMVLCIALPTTLLAVASADACPEEPTYQDGVPDPAVAIPGFPNRRATTPELNTYMRSIDEASDRVTTAAFARSWQGTPLLYSLVGTPSRLRSIADVVTRQERLRDPRITSEAEARRLARSTPAIVWYTGNVHGNETSGADAAIQILYELAARTDCEVEKMLKELVVGIIATQNPDGRDVFSRTNSYVFDMNRDWFARTQPETDGKLDLLAKYPPVLFIDAHEMGSSNFFFPPNADPIHHEISSEAVGWINKIYGRALRKAFEERQSSDPANWDYFNYDVYDLFYMGYGDTVPTTAFTAAGMTFEKGIADTDRQRWLEQFVAGWTSLTEAADHKDEILSEYYNAHVDALSEGRRGLLEPNQILQKENELKRQVPNLRIRHYFIHANRASPDVVTMIDRLLKMDVEIYRLRRSLRVRDLEYIGAPPRRGTVPKGSYWIPMAQPQKHWIQAMLGEDSYTPFPYFYDVTAWSNPLLANAKAAFSGSALDPTARRIRRAPSARIGALGRPKFYWFRGDTGRSVAAALALARDDVSVARLRKSAKSSGVRIPRGAFIVQGRAATSDLERVSRLYRLDVHAGEGRLPHGRPVAQPRVAVFAPSSAEEPVESRPFTVEGESLGHLRYLLEQAWDVPYDAMNGAEIASGGLTTGEYDIFIVPGIATADLDSAAEQIRTWVEDGGIYVGTARPGDTGGTPYAIDHGYTTATSDTPGAYQVPGTMFRVRVNRRSPITLGAPRTAYWFNLGESVLSKSDSGVNAVTYPGRRGFWFSGYAGGVRGLRKSAGLVDETLGNGHVLLFSGEPNFRAFTDGPSLFLANALLYPRDEQTAARDISAAHFRDELRRAASSVGRATGPGRPISIAVPRRYRARAAQVISGFTHNVTTSVRGTSVFFTIPNPRGLDVETHPFSFRLLPALFNAGVRVRAAIL